MTAKKLNAVEIQAENESIALMMDSPNRLLTVDITRAQVHASIVALTWGFTEMEQRIVADNGITYRPDVELPAGVETDGSIVMVNRYAYLAKQLAGVVCWKLETMLDAMDKKIDDQRAKIKSSVRQLENGRGVITGTTIDRYADFLEMLIEQRCFIAHAYDEARVAYDACIGEEFETGAMRAERERTKAAARPSDQTERLKRLGIS